jgi:capsular exopolysaccharide synthesis family protein
MLLRLRQNLETEKSFTMTDSVETDANGLGVCRLDEQLQNSPDINEKASSHIARAHARIQLSPGKKESPYPMLVIGAEAMARLAEPFHSLRITLDSWRADKTSNVLLVTSALSGEGKSFVAFNLAACFASAGTRTLFIDADLRSSIISRALNAESNAGLGNYLETSIRFEGCVCETSMPELFLLPAGNTTGSNAKAAQLLGSERMRQLLSTLRTSGTYGLVILDTAAAESVPDPYLMMPFVDAVLPVVAANSTPREVVKQMLQRIDPVPVVGMVLNRFEPPRSRRASHYYPRI